MNKEKVKGALKKHWPKIAVGVAAVVGTGVAVKLGLDHRFGKTVKMPGFTIEGPLTIADMGRLGEEYIKHDPDLTPETNVLEVGSFIFE